MNKYQKALYELKMVLIYNSYKYSDSRLIDLNLETIDELVEQSSQKKPIIKIEEVPLYGMMADSHRRDCYQRKMYCCPKCDKVIYRKEFKGRRGSKSNHCPDCGQALDWGE